MNYENLRKAALQNDDVELRDITKPQEKGPNMEETVSYRGYEIRIQPDSDPVNPRREFDHAGTMVCWHSRYELGDRHWNASSRSQAQLFDTPKEFQQWWNENGKGGLLLPLYLYDHSGITISAKPFSCPWDSGQVGWTYITAETIAKEWGKGPKAKKQAEKCLLAEVEEYDQYLRGDVWGFIIDPDGADESCWGFYGYDYCLEEAKSVVDSLVERDRKAKLAKAKAYIRNSVPLEKRMFEKQVLA